jgi:hypothetical protein
LHIQSSHRWSSHRCQHAIFVCPLGPKKWHALQKGSDTEASEQCHIEVSLLVGTAEVADSRVLVVMGMAGHMRMAVLDCTIALIASALLNVAVGFGYVLARLVDIELLSEAAEEFVDKLAGLTRLLRDHLGLVLFGTESLLQLQHETYSDCRQWSVCWL